MVPFPTVNCTSEMVSVPTPDPGVLGSIDLQSDEHVNTDSELSQTPFPHDLPVSGVWTAQSAGHESVVSGSTQTLSPQAGPAGGGMTEQSAEQEEIFSVALQILSPHTLGTSISGALGIPEARAPEANCEAVSFAKTPK